MISYSSIHFVDITIIIIKVQAIWDSLDADSLAVEDIDEQKIAEVFFSVGNKLDMAQIDNFYTKVSVWCYNAKRLINEVIICIP